MFGMKQCAICHLDAAKSADPTYGAFIVIEPLVLTILNTSATLNQHFRWP